MESKTEKEILAGPIIVAIANASRAFDAPVRYPLLLSRYTWVQNLSSALSLSSFSSFIVTIEHIIGALIIAPFLFVRRGRNHILSVLSSYNKRDWLSILFVSLGSGLGLYFFLISFGLGNPTVAILLQKSQPLITLLVAMILLKERPTKFFFIAAIFSLLGIFLISFEDLASASFFEFLAAFSSLIAAFFWGSNTVFGRILTDKTDYWDLTFLRYVGGSVVLILFNFLVVAYTNNNFNALQETFVTFPTLLAIPLTGLMCIIYSAILTGGVLPLTLYYFGLRWSKASVGGLAELTFPLLAIFVNFLTLGFGLSFTQIIGALILFSSVLTLSYVNSKEFKKQGKK